MESHSVTIILSNFEIYTVRGLVVNYKKEIILPIIALGRITSASLIKALAWPLKKIELRSKNKRKESRY